MKRGKSCWSGCGVRMEVRAQPSAVHNLGNVLRVASIQTHRVWLCLENTGLANRVDKGPKAPPPPPNIESWRYNDKQQQFEFNLALISFNHI